MILFWEKMAFIDLIIIILESVNLMMICMQYDTESKNPFNLKWDIKKFPEPK